MVFRVEGEFVGVAADWDGDGAPYGGAGYFKVEVVENDKSKDSTIKDGLCTACYNVDADTLAGRKRWQDLARKSSDVF